jgi:hypothetical protein
VSSCALESLFESKLAAFAAAQSPALAVSFENKNFKPPQDAHYLRATLLLAPPRAAALGSDAPDYQRGVFQVDVMGLPNTGRAPRVIADLVAKEFKRGTKMVGTGANIGTDITCESVQIAKPMSEDTRFKLPVSIVFYAYTKPA